MPAVDQPPRDIAVAVGDVASLPLFVYGTLAPGEVRWFALSGRIVGDPIPDAVTGHLYDTGWDYPAWVPGPSTGECPGCC